MKQLLLFEEPNRPKEATFEGGRVNGRLGLAPLVVSFGLGTNSVAMLIAFYQLGVRPDAIVFADTGGEKGGTYQYAQIMDEVLEEMGFPLLTSVAYRPKKFKYNPYSTIIGNCIANRTLASISFGRKSCSLKWKGAAIDKWVRAHYATPVYRAIGYDCSPRDTKRFTHAKTMDAGRADEYIYPLHIVGWDRDECNRQIALMGLPSPGKSACIICGASKPHELVDFTVEELITAVIVEANASVNLRTVKGIWRSSSMTDYIKAEGLLPVSIVERIWRDWGGEERFAPLDIPAETALRDYLGKLAQ